MDTADYVITFVFFGLVLAGIIDCYVHTDSREVRQFIQMLADAWRRVRR